MSTLLASDPVPLRVDADGVIRVGPTRVTLDSLVTAFDEGATAEEMSQQYPALLLADIYAAIAHVLRHRREVDTYLAGRRQAADRVRAEITTRSAQVGIRERLMARRIQGS